MNKGRTNITFTNFFTNSYYYESLINKIIKAKKVIGDNIDKKELIEALLVKFLTIWELFIEDLLIDCFNKDTSKYSIYMGVGIPTHLTRNTCFCILSGLGFFDIRGMNEATKLSKKILIDKYNPFLIKKDKIKGFYSKVEDFYTFRNLITHWSQKSLNNYKKLLKGEKFNYKRVPEIGNFLLKKGKNGKYIINDYIENFNDLAYELLIFARDNGIISKKEFDKSIEINGDEVIVLK